MADPIFEKYGVNVVLDYVFKLENFNISDATKYMFVRVYRAKYVGVQILMGKLNISSWKFRFRIINNL